MQVNTEKCKKRMWAPAAKLRLNSNFASAVWNWKILLRTIFNKIYTFKKTKLNQSSPVKITNSAETEDIKGGFF